MSKGLFHGCGVVAACVGLALTLPMHAAAQRSGVEIWAANCGRCHIAQPTNKFDATGWERVGMHMTITARLTTAESEAVVAFLRSSVPTSGAQGTAAVVSPASLPATFARHQPVANVEETFSKLCAPCHGAEGKGDGVAAIALNPKPRNFASDEFGEYTMDQIVTSITTGKGAMPAWGPVLSPDEIKRLAEYVSELGHGARAATAALVGVR